jgi:protein-S-isoprenylcysteine O-methyltransferase Ste14
MELIGKTTINPVLFFSGKISGYLTWIILGISFLKINIVHVNSWGYNKDIAFVILSFGFFAVVLSSINLGRSTRLGLPSNDTQLKTNGIYKISRNPMYLGFNLLTISSIIYMLNPIVSLFGIYSIIIYHFIIIGEERFLETRFGTAYLDFKKRVRRYL